MTEEKPQKADLRKIIECLDVLIYRDLRSPDELQMLLDARKAAEAQQEEKKRLADLKNDMEEHIVYSENFKKFFARVNFSDLKGWVDILDKLTASKQDSEGTG